MCTPSCRHRALSFKSSFQLSYEFCKNTELEDVYRHIYIENSLLKIDRIIDYQCHPHVIRLLGYNTGSCLMLLMPQKQMASWVGTTEEIDSGTSS